MFYKITNDKLGVPQSQNVYFSEKKRDDEFQDFIEFAKEHGFETINLGRVVIGRRGNNVVGIREYNINWGDPIGLVTFFSDGTKSGPRDVDKFYNIY